MTPEAALASLKNAVGRGGEDLVIRRYTSDGPLPSRIEAKVRGRAVGAGAGTLVGNVGTTNYSVVVVVDPGAPVEDGYVPLQDLLPLKKSDVVMIDNGERELAIVGIDDRTRRVSGILFGLNIQATGR